MQEGAGRNRRRPEKAEELLRIKGAKATKAASRIAAEGVIGAFVSGDSKIGAWWN